MKNGVKKKKLVLKKWVRTFIILVLLIFFLVALFLIFTGLFPKYDSSSYYDYNVKRNIDYKVYFKENDFFDEPYLEKGKQYTADLIDYIDIDLSYLFNGSSVTNMNYDYDVTATIKGEYENTSSGKSELWTKEYSLLENQSKHLYDTTQFDINQNIKINYDVYSNIVEEFKKQFNIEVDAYLNVKLSIKYNGIIQKNKLDVTGTDKLEINIPLTEDIISINTKYDDETNDSLTPEANGKDMTRVYFGIALIIVDIILLIMVHDKVFVSKKTYYIKVLNKILKNYGSIIVEVSNPVNLEGLEVLEIKNFNDMIDVEEELKSPILLYETIEGKESYFIIVNDKYAYTYILNNDNYEK